MPAKRSIWNDPLLYAILIALISALLLAAVVLFSNNSATVPDMNNPKNWPACAVGNTNTINQHPDLYHCKPSI